MKNEIATLTETEKNFLNNLLADDVIKPTVVKPFTAKLSPETFVFLEELEIIEAGTSIYRFLKIACQRKAELDCQTKIDEGNFDVIELQLKNNKIKLALPVFVQNKYNLMKKKDLAVFKKAESAKFKLMRKFYRDANDERVLDLVFNVQMP